jgi:magnesium chelatase family protein
MLSKIQSTASYGIDPILVDCEVDSRNGLPAISIVGLPDTIIKESKERVLSAINNSGLVVPVNKKITINLAPAEVKKVGSYYDLPIAIGILVSTGQIHIKFSEKFLMIGELSLGGKVKAVQGVLLTSILAKEKDIKYVFVPEENAKEASLVKDVKVIAVRTITETIQFLTSGNLTFYTTTNNTAKEKSNLLDFCEVKGQTFAKRAIEIAASGGHNLFLIGPPGCGKSMIAKRMPTILPDLTEEEALSVIKIHSISGKTKKGFISRKRPFRSPHHTISYAGLIGGTASSKPGEISLAHKGVLFLDEILEFNRQSIESLRQPMEDGEIVITRAQNSFKYPASFILIASANPCPCGFATHPTISCTCNSFQKQQYLKKMSGPLIDRFDLVVELKPLSEDDLLNNKNAESSIEIKERVEKARIIQLDRFNKKDITLNSEMREKEINNYCKLSEETNAFMKQAIKKYSLSGRSLNRLQKVSRTIADMDKSKDIQLEHLLEALHFRRNIINV